MTAAALARLRELGVTAEARGDRLTLRPASAVPADLRALKAEVMALLSVTLTDASGLTAANRAEAAAPPRAPTLVPATPKKAADVAADRSALEPDEWPSEPSAPTDPPAGLVERLAHTLATPRPWQRVTDPENARQYFMAEARRRLGTLLDPMAWGLLVQAAEVRVRQPHWTGPSRP